MPSKPGERKRRSLNWKDERVQMALALRFEGRLTSAEAAEKISTDCQKSVPASTVRDWWQHPDFQAKLKEMRNDLLNSLDTLDIAYHRKEQRVVGLARVAELARRDYEQRRFLREYRPVMGGGERRHEGRGDGKGEKSRPTRSDDLDAGKAIAAVEELFGLPPSGEAANKAEQPPAEPTAARVIDGLPPGVDPASCIINESYNDAAGRLFQSCLDDIAKEFGDRKVKSEVTGTIDVRERVLFVVPAIDDEDETDLVTGAVVDADTDTDTDALPASRESESES